MYTTIYLEANGDDVYMAWTGHPKVFGLNLCTFREDAANAVEDLISAMTGLGFDLGDIYVCEGVHEYDKGVHEYEIDAWLYDNRQT